jgi:hypothetical protein
MALCVFLLWRNDDLAVSYSVCVQYQAELTSTKDALEDQVGKASNIGAKVRWTLELVLADRNIELHCSSRLLGLPPLRPPCFLCGSNLSAGAC